MTMVQTLEDYKKIETAIAFMEENYYQQPDLATIAQHIHLSEYHFQRLFTKWTGISPKRFLQNLTIKEAKERIFPSKSLLDLSFDIGLSSPGRLHDLFVNLEAVSPGEYKSYGAGLEIRYGIHHTPFGRALIATTIRGICNFYFVDDVQQALDSLGVEWAKAKIIRDDLATGKLIKQIFSLGLECNKPVALWVKGTNFQVQVWRALLDIPFGCVTNYEKLAQEINNSQAARAVGNALNHNPISLLIPCHRVIKKSGELGGYRWGLARKCAILTWESEIKKNENG